MDNKYEKWGDLQLIPDTDSGIAQLEREQMTKPRPMQVEGPVLHQPSSQPCPPTNQAHPAENFALDSVTLHTIKLIQYAKKIKSLIQNVPQIIDNARQEKEAPSFPDPPPMPEFDRRQMKNKFMKPFPFLPANPDSEFSRGIGKSPVEVDDKSCRRLLRSSVALLCAHTGYDSCSESVLETLTDACHEYMVQITKLMRQATDTEARVGQTGFQDVMEQVFHEMGLGSVTVLHEFYQTRVLKYHQHMLETCQTLLDEYEKAKNPELRPADDKPSRIKEDALSEIHFPTTEDIDELMDSVGLRMEGGLGLDMSNMGQEGASGSEDSEAQNKSETQDQKASSSSNDTYDQQETSSGGEMPNTPNISTSEAGDDSSIQDPASVPLSDMASPPPPPPAKKIKK